MIGLVQPGEYYTRMQRGPILNQLYQIGQFFSVPSLYLFDERQSFLLKSRYNQVINDYQYQVDPFRRSEFDNDGEPDHTLGISSNERAIIVKAKKRPVIIISNTATMWTDSRRRQDDSFLVAPVYSFGGDETKLSYSQAFIERVKAYEYWQLFYLPEHTPARVRESFVRLDRIQAVHKNLLEHIPLMLSDVAQDLLLSWIRVYLGENLEDVNDLLADYRNQAIANIP